MAPHFASCACLIFLLVHAKVEGSVCISGSIFPSWFDGRYEYNGKNKFGATFLNAQTNRSLFPWIEDNGYAQYLIGDNSDVHVANAWSTMGSPPSLNYSFEPEDFIKDWQTWAFDSNLGHHVINDTNKRVVRCEAVCIKNHSNAPFDWIHYNLSNEASVYFDGNNSYLYRSNINTNNEQWQLLNKEGLSILSLSDIHSAPCNAIFNGLHLYIYVLFIGY